ncbi:hypothetical protein JTB14_003601 [Gonioctena quinquepunctata]|nr:hypothetical protein JTB14_003601 [Gonioctena quinquepunctata]
MSIIEIEVHYDKDGKNQVKVGGECSKRGNLSGKTDEIEVLSSPKDRNIFPEVHIASQRNLGGSRDKETSITCSNSTRRRILSFQLEAARKKPVLEK